MSIYNAQFGEAIFGTLVFGDLDVIVDITKFWIDICPVLSNWAPSLIAESQFIESPLIQSMWALDPIEDASWVDQPIADSEWNIRGVGNTQSVKCRRN